MTAIVARYGHITPTNAPIIILPGTNKGAMYIFVSVDVHLAIARFNAKQDAATPYATETQPYAILIVFLDFDIFS